MHALPIAVTKKAWKDSGAFPGWRIVAAEHIAEDAAAYVVAEKEMDTWKRAVGNVPVLSLGTPADEIMRAAAAREMSLLPPFTRALAEEAGKRPLYFATPGHHSGAFFQKTAAGRVFTHFLGEALFGADLSDSDDAIGDVSSHEGPGGAAERLAAEVYHADRTYFVLNGTSASNRICCAALLAPGDRVLFDRNNHKSLYQAIVQCGAVPVYLTAERNGAGVIGGISGEALDAARLREMAGGENGKDGRRPFRLACIELATYDGFFCNAKDIIHTLSPLCDYILFDGAWAGYESLIPFMKDQSPLTLPLTREDPGILVTQSVHKQLAGFSQTSQIQRKDSHLEGEKRRVRDEVFQDAFAMHISTSPFFPLFAGLEMNAKIHKEKGGELWQEAMRFAVELRKDLLRQCRHLRPFQPEMVGGRPWTSYSTEEIIGSPAHFAVDPEAPWHGFSHVRKGQYLLDPCKVLVLTEGVDPVTGEYKATGIPAPILSLYLQAHGIVPEKTDFYTVLFLAEPGDTEGKRQRLMDVLRQFEKDYEKDAPLPACLPGLAGEAPERYRDMGLQGLCHGQHQFFKTRGAGTLEKAIFDRRCMPETAMIGGEAHAAFIRGEGKRMPLAEAEGCVALTGAAAYPPGICTVAAGEIWNRPAVRWFQLLIDYANAFPGFGCELHGIQLERDGKGKLQGYCWVK